MDIQASLPKIKELIEKSKDIVIVTHEKPTIDSIGASLSLYLGLLGLGKKATIVCPDPMTVEFSNFIGANRMETKLSSKKNFIISLDYQEGSIEKVSYNIEGNKFNLVIEPRAGFDGFSSDKVHYITGNNQADLFITIDTVHLGELRDMYEAEKELFATHPIINVDTHENNTMYGAVNCVDIKSSSTTELVAVMMSYIGVKLTDDVATNLFNAITLATDNFQKASVNARTFEVASVCLKAGAKRFESKEPENVTSGVTEVTEEIKSIPQSQGQTEDWLKPKIIKGQAE